MAPPPGLERRRWSRLPLSIPVFVRGRDLKGEKFLDFTVLLDISAGGTLLAIRRTLRRSSPLLLEIPSGPIAIRASNQLVKKLRARILRMTRVDGWNLYGLQFTRPIT